MSREIVEFEYRVKKEESHRWRAKWGSWYRYCIQVRALYKGRPHALLKRHRKDYWGWWYYMDGGDEMDVMYFMDEESASHCVHLLNLCYTNPNEFDET